MTQKIPVHLRFQNQSTHEYDYLLPATTAELVQESDERQFMTKRMKDAVQEIIDGSSPIVDVTEIEDEEIQRIFNGE